VVELQTTLVERVQHVLRASTKQQPAEQTLTLSAPLAQLVLLERTRLQLQVVEALRTQPAQHAPFALLENTKPLLARQLPILNVQLARPALQGSMCLKPALDQQTHSVQLAQHAEPTSTKQWHAHLQDQHSVLWDRLPFRFPTSALG
jgi:hypothetical protein